MNPIQYVGVYPTQPDVVNLIEQLNRYQIELYGIPSCTLESPESLEQSGAFMIAAYNGNELAGIGAIKFPAEYAEIKRMYVREEFRKLSIARGILTRLEAYAFKQQIFRICLETGNLQTAAIQFYHKMGYKQIAAFGIYKPNHASIYMEKSILENVILTTDLDFF